MGGPRGYRLLRIAAGASVLAAAAPAALADDTARLALGRMLFSSAVPSCALCHVLKDAGTSGKLGPALDELRPDAERVATALRQGVGVMPSYRDKLSESEILAIARYVSKATGAEK